MEQLTAQFRVIRLRLKRKAWLLAAFGAAALLVSIQFVLESYSVPATRDVVLVVLSLVAIWLLLAGLAGSTTAVVFGTGKIQRYLFGTALCGAIVAFSFNGAWTQIVGGISTIFVFIGGTVVFLSELRERYRTNGMLRSIQEDFLNGVVWHFEREFPTGDPDSPALRQTAGVFPKSRLLVALNDVVPSKMAIVAMSETAAGGTGAADAPLASYRPTWSSEDMQYRQRHLTPEEIAELSSLLRGELRRLVPYILVLFWSSTAVAAAAEAFTSHRPSAMTGRSLVLGVTFTVACLVKYLRKWRRVRADLRGGIVVVLRPNHPDANEISFETLPNSNRIWSEFGAPSRWRYRPVRARSS
jgi:hypothetical protein